MKPLKRVFSWVSFGQVRLDQGKAGSRSRIKGVHREYDSQMDSARKRFREEVLLGLRKPNPPPPQDEKRIEAAGGANFSDADLDIAHKWALNFDSCKGDFPSWEVPLKDSNYIQKINEEAFVFTQFMMKTQYYGGYLQMLDYIKHGKEFEACFEDGKLDLTKSARMLSERTEMTSKAKDILLSEYGVDSLEDLHDMFFRCVIPQIKTHEMKEFKERESHKTADLYENYGTYLCLCSLGISIFYFGNKAKKLREEASVRSSADRELYDSIFLDQFLSESTAEQISDENQMNRK
jgi:hypothetical protein